MTKRPPPLPSSAPFAVYEETDATEAYFEGFFAET